MVDFTYAFRGVVAEVGQDRPLDGLEVELHFALEEWATAGWDDGPEVVDRWGRDPAGPANAPARC